MVVSLFDFSWKLSRFVSASVLFFLRVNFVSVLPLSTQPGSKANAASNWEQFLFLFFLFYFFLRLVPGVIAKATLDFDAGFGGLLFSISKKVDMPQLPFLLLFLCVSLLLYALLVLNMSPGLSASPI